MQLLLTNESIEMLKTMGKIDKILFTKLTEKILRLLSVENILENFTSAEIEEILSNLEIDLSKFHLLVR